MTMQCSLRLSVAVLFICFGGLDGALYGAHPHVQSISLDHAIAANYRRVRISESTVVMAIQGEPLLIEFDRAVLHMKSTRAAWPTVRMVDGEERLIAVSSLQAGEKWLSVVLGDGSTIRVQFVFSKGRRLPLHPQVKTAYSVVGPDGREKQFSVAASSITDLRDVLGYLYPDHQFVIGEAESDLLLRGQVATDSDRDRIEAVASCFFQSVRNQLVVDDNVPTGDTREATVADEAESYGSADGLRWQQLQAEVRKLRRQVQQLTPKADDKSEELVGYSSERLPRSSYFGDRPRPDDGLYYFHRSFAGKRDPVVRALEENPGELRVYRPWQQAALSKLTANYRVKTTPTLILLQGGKEVDRIEGELSEIRLQRLFKATQPPGKDE